jgi:hypothetical protein
MEITEITREEYVAWKKARARAYREKYKLSGRTKELVSGYSKTEKYKARQKKWRTENSERTRNYKYKNLYNITVEQKEALLAAQNNACAICKSTETSAKGWHVDHSHKTGVVRGILCHRCNLGLGNFRDDLDILRAVIDYLTSNK